MLKFILFSRLSRPCRCLEGPQNRRTSAKRATLGRPLEPLTSRHKVFQGDLAVGALEGSLTGTRATLTASNGYKDLMFLQFYASKWILLRCLDPERYDPSPYKPGSHVPYHPHQSWAGTSPKMRRGGDSRVYCSILQLLWPISFSNISVRRSFQKFRVAKRFLSSSSCGGLWVARTHVWFSFGKLRVVSYLVVLSGTIPWLRNLMTKRGYRQLTHNIYTIYTSLQ